MENTDGSAFSAVLDKDVTKERVLGLSSPNAVAEFFKYLGYNTKARMSQTPVEFGITNKELASKIKFMERLAINDSGPQNVLLI